MVGVLSEDFEYQCFETFVYNSRSQMSSPFYVFHLWPNLNGVHPTHTGSSIWLTFSLDVAKRSLVEESFLDLDESVVGEHVLEMEKKGFPYPTEYSLDFLK